MKREPTKPVWTRLQISLIKCLEEDSEMEHRWVSGQIRHIVSTYYKRHNVAK
jgi:hypothetical protein